MKACFPIRLLVKTTILPYQIQLFNVNVDSCEQYTWNMVSVLFNRNKNIKKLITIAAYQFKHLRITKLVVCSSIKILKIANVFYNSNSNTLYKIYVRILTPLEIRTIGCNIKSQILWSSETLFSTLQQLPM